MVLDMSHTDASSKTFSDKWYRVASVRGCLRTSVRAHRQRFGSEYWVILRDTLSSDFFRITVPAYEFLARLDGRRTVEEVWNQAIEIDPEGSLTQEEVVQLLGQLQLSNLLQFDKGAAAKTLFERHETRRKREFRAALRSFWSMKLPLIDPDKFLEQSLPALRLLFGPAGLIFYIILIFFGIKSIIDEGDKFWSQSAGFLARAILAFFI